MEMASKAAERFAEQRKKQQAEIRARVAKAKAASKQEKFDFKVFAKLYDVSQDHGSQPVTPEMIERYEEEYYLGPVQASTIQEFAAKKEELKLHDSN
jgi:hypothetical protein